MTFEPIAIVGRGCALPDVLDASTLWENVRDGHVALSPACPHDWRLPPDWLEHGLVGPIPAIGGFVRGFDEVFDPAGFRLPAEEIRGWDPAVRWLLHAGRAALDEAGGTELLPRAGLVLGSLGYPSRTQSALVEQAWQSRLPLRARVIPEYGPLDPHMRFWPGLPVHSASAALGLGGTALVLDAACASSLYAIKLACDRLHDRRADLMLAGGVSGADGLMIHLGFAGLGALSPTGSSRPFHPDADGLVPAEGAALVALMRYADAVRGNHRVLGVIRGIGLSNDGAAGGFLAPARAGQERAMRAAYRDAGLDPATVTLLECHATGTPLGDVTELASAASVFRGCADLPFGSMKGNLGHALTAAGAAGLLKVLGALQSGIRPISLGGNEITDVPTGSSLRLLHTNEPWAGPHRAAISAFGFGGNNAHLIVDGPSEPVAIRPYRVPAAHAETAAHAEQVAVVAIGARVGAGESAADLSEALLAGVGTRRRERIDLAVEGLRFPPNDLRQGPAQALVLEAAREAAAGTALPRNTMVLVGMGCDPHGARSQAGARHACWAAHYGDGPETAVDFGGDFSPAYVTGSMANIYANRIGAQFDFTGPAFAIAAEESSGPIGLQEAARALLAGAVDAALVGAVELSGEPAHSAALTALDPEAQPGDAAVVLALKRLTDARRDGNDVLAILDTEAGPADLSVGPGTEFDVRDLFGSAHAATGLVTVATAVFALRHRARFRVGRAANPALAADTAAAIVALPDGSPMHLRLRAGDRAGALATRTGVRVFSGADAEQAIAALEAGQPSNRGPARLAVVAESVAAAALRSGAARQWLLHRGLRPPGMAFRSAPLVGETAFVFPNGSAATAGMGRSLLLALPNLVDAVSRRFGGLSASADWVYADTAPAPSAIDRIQAVTGLAAIHAAVTRDVLGIEPSAAIGYSSGESTALLALGAWTDPQRILRVIRRSELFSRDLAGDLRAVRRAWAEAGVPGEHWRTYLVGAGAERIRAAIEDQPAVHLMTINSPDTCVIGGEERAVAAVLTRLIDVPALPVDYEMAAHAPELAAVRDEWYRVHLHPVAEVAGTRFYSGATGEPYPLSSARVAQAITDQGLGTVDYVRLIERAYADGVRIFVEHGPGSMCTGWITRILGKREHLAVALDARPDDAVAGLYTALADLAVAGVAMNLPALERMLGSAPESGTSPVVRKVPIAARTGPVHLAGTPSAADMAIAPILTYPGDDAEIRTSPPRIGALASAQYRLITVAHARHVALAAEAHQRYLAHSARLLCASTRTGTAPSEPARPTTTLVESPAQQAGSRPDRPGPTFDRADLERLATGRISEFFGSTFAAQDDDARQTRMPGPPMLLADRVTGIDAEPATLGTGTIWTETDIRSGSWYLDHAGRMPPGLLVEAGQADLLLISWLGADLENRGRRVYRLLGCEVTFHAGMPSAGTLLDYEIRIIDHTADGARRLFFFEFDCRADGKRQLSVRNGQAGFFTDEELAASGGVLWDPSDRIPEGAADPVAIRGDRTSFTREQLHAFAAGRPVDCFGPGWRMANTHVRTPRIAKGHMLLLDEVTEFDPAGGPWGRGYLRAVRAVHPEDWFFEGHFHNDPCMPGTVMVDACGQAMSFYLAAAGFTVQRDAWVFEPVPEQPYSIRCRGQVTPQSRGMVYEIFVSSLVGGPLPTLHADVLVTVDGIKALYAKNFAVRLAPSWPLTDWENSGPAITQRTGDLVPLAALGGLRGRPNDERAADIDGFPLDHRSLLACAWGMPSEALGPAYRRFDDGILRSARLPGPPYHFMTRVVAVTGPYAGFETGSSAVVEYDVPTDVWYFTENPAGTMPLSVLMEVVLQPCGWLGAYVGSFLRSDTEVFIRNLDGDIAVHTQVGPAAERISTRVELLSIAELHGMIIETFRIESRVDGAPLATGTTVFGYFSTAALADQVGIPPAEADRAELELPCDYRGTPRRRGMPGPMLLMIDAITGYWPEGGPAGLGRVRAEKTVDTRDWFFKAHFFQDPVMPGSLGVEGVAQVVQWFMLERGLGAGLTNPRFDAVAADRPLRWKYRGQVVPTDRTVTIEVDILEIADHRPASCTVLADAWLWVDGRRIYQVPRFATTLTSGPPPTEAFERLDVAVDTWLNDHRPTFSVPTLPMMSTIERLCAAAERYTGVPAAGIAEVTLSRWIPVAPTALLRTRVRETSRGPMVTLAAWRAAARPELSRFEDVTSAEIRTEAGQRPEPFTALPDAVVTAPPYGTGSLFHGPAFQYLTELRVGRCGATGIVDCARGSVPTGVLPQGLLDAMIHVIPHDALERWSPDIPAGCVGFPHGVRDLGIYEPIPEHGVLRVEARFAGMDGSDPLFDLQLLLADRVLLALRLVDRLFPLGGLATLTAERRLSFLRDRDPAGGAGLSRTQADGTTVLRPVTVLPWGALPGMLEQIYQLPADTRRVDLVALIAMKEHIARQAGLHPAVIVCDPRTRTGVAAGRRYSLDVVQDAESVRVSDRAHLAEDR
ncbi:beta-ketoacyl synthase N-terminal-like domain-containing protein [Nocardia sp. NPDC051756]|uniref:beta-ketoacyl synthase N-terminal-like domain-containing protein n=1 Tax=Nocardia sp. NPDC051756 TaxID=3154751 RepID=UPI0034338E3D